MLGAVWLLASFLCEKNELSINGCEILKRLMVKTMNLEGKKQDHTYSPDIVFRSSSEANYDFAKDE